MVLDKFVLLVQINLLTLDTVVEHELLRQLKGGSEDAFREVYHTYSKPLLSRLIKLVKIEAVACELLQDTFLRLWTKREQLDTSRAIRPYLYRIAENVAVDFFRKASKDRQMQQELVLRGSLHYEQDDFNTYKESDFVLLKDIIELLPPQRKLIFSLIKLENKSYDEVSEQLHISRSTISDHIVKSTKFIRSKFADMKRIAPILFFFFLFD